MTSSEQAGLAIGLIALGILVSYGIYWVYRRYNPTSGSGAGMGLLKSQPKWLKDPIRAQNNNNPSSRYFGSGNNKSAWLKGDGNGGHDSRDTDVQSEPLTGNGNGRRATHARDTTGKGNSAPSNIKMQTTTKPPSKPTGGRGMPPPPPSREQRKNPERSAYL